MSWTPDAFEMYERLQGQSCEQANQYDTRVSDMQYMMEAVHGTSAGVACVTIACDRMVDGDVDDAVFWMRVYQAITGAQSESYSSGMLLH